MFRCRMVNFLFSIFPLKIWQDFLLRKHIQDCSCCQENLASLEEAKSLLIQEGEVGDLEGLWPKVKVQLAEEERKEKYFRLPRWGWAVGAAGLLVAIILGVWLFWSARLGKPSEEPGSPFQIKYIRVHDKPARAYLFQPQDSNMIIIWAEENI
ncbi:MAG: hypothetical protein GTO17_05960 [Candidatus Aminicenantes bacterium]|nr:hypothetical protein [Candidatus Aminicenantes bacterium]